MPNYRAVLVFPGEAGEGRYEFDAPQEFIDNAPARIVDSFLSTVQGLAIQGEIVDSEINSAHNFRDIRTVTASGSLLMRDGGAVPFLAMITQNEQVL